MRLIMDELVLIGKSVSTFGIKGELKVISDFEYKDKAFKVGNIILLNNQEHKITSVRYHKNYVLVTIDSLNNINYVLDYVGYNLYIKKGSLKLNESEYLYKDLIGAKVYENDLYLGDVTEIINNSIYYLARVKKEHEFLIPLIDNFIVRFAKDEKILYTKNASSLNL
ncbi:16S rRNA processing protein RimM [bacterium]|nr:16S rRNA processing protein RimM [bacterium]